ncbi:MAG: copper homeostasis protein CutC [Chitinophagales bacterium]|nr:copper homeostasis protein CutC [Chitinophagales bacterium]MBP9189833.1 copper homeostasis protein CutC [Chitinophagales bacterium]MBP9548010.1 copper homeostasis protein CutC [Chitinophagales bacterium]MBP9704683.1 copper homeostasis protein CutC [Chitinophagales bacterium]
MQLYPMPLEICCYNATSAIVAADAGANRIELCAGASGGITPSIGTIETVCNSINIPVHVLIRPREGNFNYSKKEFEVILKDIETCEKIKVAGVVFGILDSSKKVDVNRCKELISVANGMRCIFHKAIDIVPDIESAFETIIDCGFKTVLTSGGKQNVFHGLQKLLRLKQTFGSAIQIMPGGGIRSENISAINNVLHTEWYHSSAIINTNTNEKVEMYDNNDILMCNTQEINAMQLYLNKANS